MTIEYIFIKNYRAIKNQGFNFSSKFSIDYSSKNTFLSIGEKPFHIENFYGNSIKNVTGLVGQNGVGKSTILNYIKGVLSFPLNSNPDNLDCLIVLYDSTKNEFTVVKNGMEFNLVTKNIKFKTISLNTKKDIESVDDRFKTILGEVQEFNDNAILYLSNIYDNSAETRYGPLKKPYVVNLSLNYLTKDPSDSDVQSTLKYRELENNIKFILNSNKKVFSLNLPEYITFNFKNIIVDEFLREHIDYKGDSKDSDFKEKLSELLKKIQSRSNYFQDKNIRLKFWLLANLIIQIQNYYKVDGVNDLYLSIKDCNIEDLEDKLMNFLKSNLKYLTTKHIGNKNTQFIDGFSWDNYFDNYSTFINKTLLVFNKYDKRNKSNNTLNVPLNKNSEEDIKELIELSEICTIELNIIYFVWRDMSTGETMLLRFFSNLYLFSQHLKLDDDVRNVKSLVFLFDEIEAFYHPQWQKKIMKLLFDFINEEFVQYNNQIIFSSHSPLTISDMPKSDLIFLQKNENEIVSKNNLNEHRNTFASNIHSLLTDTFFLQDGHIGDFADDKINYIINLLVDGRLKDIVEKRDEIEKIISIIGEPVIKNKLLEILESRLRANLITIKSDIETLKNKN
ncbi:AAA domain-containing protein, putative AbiEii toxin, Type IV TA system [Flavobacterium aquidurense]|uniref:ATPase AAA-type core domain-containing protein n=1 Tax=Flavobacterium frigidimaris TaxID=262320 RepID=A0ABX4BJ69_FLAFR|nr:AAA family ATPase [Flavobacterium frigidimaris]OXA74854.1 hypothetical protein B0A65_22965 [Flavobacterium frigidimaris]SDY49961.1 AAA domain-containing protein, putative AbiEii toxin, Type IV TA system [Flavobacterium aquidurense]